jgi:hypothetical protein
MLHPFGLLALLLATAIVSAPARAQPAGLACIGPDICANLTAYGFCIWRNSFGVVQPARPTSVPASICVRGTICYRDDAERVARMQQALDILNGPGGDRADLVARALLRNAGWTSRNAGVSVTISGCP